MSALTALFSNLNPVLDRELRQRSRSARSVLVMSLLLTALAGVLYLTHLASSDANNPFRDPLQTLANSTGAAMYEWVLFAELALLLLIIPGISASAISGERDRQTLIPLQVTLISRFGLFVGKVAASSAFVLLLLVASAPLLAVPFLVGGISLERILLGFFVTMTTGVIYATLGVACSSVFRRTQTATLVTYVLMFTAVVGSLVAVAALAIVQTARGEISDPSTVPLLINPFVGVADGAGEFNRSFDFAGPFSGIKDTMWNRDGGLDNSALPGWLLSLMFQAGFTALWVIAALNKLRLPQRELD